MSVFRSTEVKHRYNINYAITSIFTKNRDVENVFNRKTGINATNGVTNPFHETCHKTIKISHVNYMYTPVNWNLTRHYYTNNQRNVPFNKSNGSSTGENNALSMFLLSMTCLDLLGITNHKHSTFVFKIACLIGRRQQKIKVGHRKKERKRGRDKERDV